MFDVLVGFSANAELSVYYPPSRESKKPVTRGHRGVAGSSINNLCGFAANGINARGLIPLGDDDFGAAILGRAAEWGLNIRPLMWRPETSYSLVLVRDDGKVKYYAYRPPYMMDKVEAEQHILIEEVEVYRPRVRLVTGVRLEDVPLVRPFLSVNGDKALRVMNPGSELVKDGVMLTEMLRLTDLVVLNQEELGNLMATLDIGRPEQVFEFGLTEILVTDSIRGAKLLKRDQSLHQPAFRVDDVDSTGAGDCFLSHFLSARLKGDDDETCLRFAAAAAAEQTRMNGGSAVPSREAIDHLLREGTLHQRVETNAEAQ